MSGIIRTVPLLVSESRARSIASRKAAGAECVSASVRYIPYWVSCHTFHIKRLFMKPRPMDIWTACDARSGATFPIRIDREVFEERETEESSRVLEPALTDEEAREKNRTAAYEAFVKRYLAMRDPDVELSFNELVYFPMWVVVMDGPKGAGGEVIINGRTETLERRI